MAFAEKNPLIKIIESLVRGNPDSLSSFVETLEFSEQVEGTITSFYCHKIQLDGNGTVRTVDFIDYLARFIVGYAIPRKRVADAIRKDSEEGLGVHMLRLQEEAKKLFVPLQTSGEGGEILLFVLGEQLLKLPQLFCKMSVKTSGSMHYHGADGVHVGISEDDFLELYWGESKFKGEFSGALRECLNSIEPILSRTDDTEDLLLLQNHLDLNDPVSTKLIKRMLDKDAPEYNKVVYCGLCLIGFNESDYNLASIEGKIAGWRDSVARSLKQKKLDEFKIHFFCLPLVSTDDFKKMFLKRLGLSK